MHFSVSVFLPSSPLLSSPLLSLSLSFFLQLVSWLVLSHSRGNVSRQGALDTFIPYISLTRTFHEGISRPWGTCPSVAGDTSNEHAPELCDAFNFIYIAVKYSFPRWLYTISAICAIVQYPQFTRVKVLYNPDMFLSSSKKIWYNNNFFKIIFILQHKRIQLDYIYIIMYDISWN